ncbi:hypothetical protein EYZ11_007647 [Aspergillus tanneri]|uniref:Clathrin light chain n=1 Tax=Aspergillus tanneri TaxID=1220188 RepID=A0A4S3JCF7_9EURO|nr:hypothetical protein EYZ11_007647 [Aspergillus tanneri]
MADRFPSLEDFSAGQTEVVNTNGASNENDFLARERAVLGDDAEQFATSQDHVATSEDVDNGDDLLGGAEDAPFGGVAREEISGFESSFPAIETQNEANPEEESEPIKEWREKRDVEVSRRAEISEEKKNSTIQKAREDIDDFYVSYNNKTDKLRAQTRAEAEQFLANREDTSSGGTSWERIAKLVDISGKGTKGGASGSGKERFRELLLDLKKDQNAPGVSGV